MNRLILIAALLGATPALAVPTPVTVGQKILDPAADLANLDTALSGVNGALAKLGTGSKALQTHETFIGKLQDSLDAGVGNLVDADLAKESARLTALQTKQQLGVQALSIANQAPQIILSLFRS